MNWSFASPNSSKESLWGIWTSGDGATTSPLGMKRVAATLTAPTKVNEYANAHLTSRWKHNNDSPNAPRPAPFIVEISGRRLSKHLPFSRSHSTDLMLPSNSVSLMPTSIALFACEYVLGYFFVSIS